LTARALLLAAALLASLAPARAAQGDERFVAPRQLFAPPPAGSYVLPPILVAPDGHVVDERGRSRRLGEITGGRITLLSFIYTHCTDPAGCPLAIATLAQVRDRLAQDPVAARGAQLVSLSFDPEYDTPEVMRMFARTFAGQGRGPAWHFLTTASQANLAPLLEGFGQDASPAPGASGARRLDHTLRVFLIDRRSRVREIYSSAYLLPEVIVNDILTVAGEGRGSPR
jgi:cytochrome oxidase Cu insertion factor (SCO1/SenC/PrrC family)